MIMNWTSVFASSYNQIRSLMFNYEEEIMRKKRKFLAAVMAVTLSMTGIFGTGITARADSCGGLEEEDIYTPDDDEVIKDPVLHWAIRSSMNAIKSNVKLTADMVGDKSVRNISFELCSHADDFATWENHSGLRIWKESSMQNQRRW